MLKKAIFLSILLISCVSFETFSQVLEGGLGIGASQYKGDLNTSFNPLLSRPGVQAMVRYNFSRAFSLKAETSFMMLEGNDNLSFDAVHKERAFKFTSLVHEYHLDLEYNFLNFRSTGTIYKADWTPILFAGFGQFYSPYRRLEVDGTAADPDQAGARYSLRYGFGFKKKLNTNWNLTVNFASRQFFKYDLLDGFGYEPSGAVNSSYSDPTLISQYDTPDTHTSDKYFYTGITLSYVLHGVRCPNPRK
ncbi:type IX secretion system protein PorG [Jiulongibacter sp. NS-SX5]|uniref:type IX secretion system protein PorG n=1 Tax=Jiulongibacter sp. NS-SX5 TaxID=3463854 RepID=UPI004058D990